MQQDTVTDMATMPLPWGKELTLQQVAYEGGMTMLRLRFREGRRFTTIDLDPNCAARLGADLARWAEAQAAPPSPE